jgi:hypothetical protein
MSEFESFHKMVEAGYDAIAGIDDDATLTPGQKLDLIGLDPTIQAVRRGIAEILAAEEALIKFQPENPDN